MTRPGFVCDCIFGSPEPGKVKLVPEHHELNCPIRRKIMIISVLITVDLMVKHPEVILPRRLEKMARLVLV
jgi:hypothetical protein